MTDSNRRFLCIHCGCRFNLTDEENKVYEQGYYAIDLDCCDDCYNGLSYVEYPEYSDADPWPLKLRSMEKIIKIQEFYRQRGKYDKRMNIVPKLTLSGNWLADAGFQPSVKMY